MFTGTTLIEAWSLSLIATFLICTCGATCKPRLNCPRMCSAEDKSQTLTSAAKRLRKDAQSCCRYRFHEPVHCSGGFEIAQYLLGVALHEPGDKCDKSLLPRILLVVKLIVSSVCMIFPIVHREGHRGFPYQTNSLGPCKQYFP